jgi:hypothetical protein
MQTEEQGTDQAGSSLFRLLPDQNPTSFSSANLYNTPAPAAYYLNNADEFNLAVHMGMHFFLPPLLYHDLRQFQHGVAAAAARCPGALHVAPAAPVGLSGAHGLPARADVFPSASAPLLVAAGGAATVPA